MRILVDINHPSQVHLFKYVIRELRNRGHEVIITASQKDVSFRLLDEYGFDYIKMGSYGDTMLQKVFKLFVLDFRMLRTVWKYKPDVLTGVGSFRAAHAGFLFGKKTIILEDTEHSTEQIALYKPFVTKILTPACFMMDLGSKQVRYEGCHELAYLYPKYFTPDPTLLDKWEVSRTEKFAVVRFVSWKASHDIGQYGFANEQKLNFIKELAKYARPYITSEGTLPPEFEPYRLKIPVHQIHHLMAFAALYVGEGATMASESAILGVPAVYVSTLKMGNMSMFESYGLLKQTADTQQALQYCIEWLKDPQTAGKCMAAREKFLADKIDVTDYLVNTIEQTGRSG